MNNEVFVKWNNGVGGGIFKISSKWDTISYEIVSGSAIDYLELAKFLWNSPILEELRASVKTLERRGVWRVQTRTGLSGCTDWYIQYNKNGLIKRTASFHKSMADKANEAFKLWSKDLYDILWWMSYKGAPLVEVSELIFKDITDEVITRRKEFDENSLPPACGFGGKTPEEIMVDEDALYS